MVTVFGMNPMLASYRSFNNRFIRRSALTMESLDGRYKLSYNGMIYNYKELRVELRTLGCNLFRNLTLK